jgi:membrane-bound lytic murein transglycosylase D
MHALFVLSLLCVYLQSTHATAQNQFDAAQSKIIRSASEQWLCRELNDVNKAYFNCNTKGWVLPEVGAFPLFNDTVQIDEEHIKRFQELWFPQGDCKHFLAAVAMADVYMPLFKRKAQQFELPEDVAYLPVVLSGCDQHYLSGDKAGLWALNYLAARRQHLRIDTLVDERLGGDFTTDAALRHFAYLKQLHKGDTWRAAVAYCDGASHISQLDSLERGPSIMQLIDTNVSDRLLFLAYTVSLFRSVHLENQLSVCFDILGHYQPIIIEKPIQLKAIAAVLSIDEGRLRSTNPVYTGEYILPGYRRVPFVLEETLAGRFESLQDSIAKWQPSQLSYDASNAKLEWVYYRVGKDDSLEQIALDNFVTVDQLVDWNKLKSEKVRRGKRLKILRVK